MRQIIGWYATAVAIIAACIVGWGWYNLDRRAPIVPPYPNAINGTGAPDPLVAQWFGESFGGFETRNSGAAVREYYDTALREQGWEGRWYRNRADYCYTLLIIDNDPVRARVAPDVNSFAFKLRQAFNSELDTIAPPGCK